VVEKLLDAGAIPIGKTNMDQFATGLVGTRSPYGMCSSVFDAHYISGGSSSGSAVAVAKELVSFSLGTDTAGSGRIPAAFNNLIGLKPTRGLLSAAGVVPACRSLDCVSIFAATCSDAYTVWRAAKGLDGRDPYSREPAPGNEAAPWAGGKFRFGVPPVDRLEFFGDQEYARLYHAAVARLEQLGGAKVEIDFSIFRAAAELLYSGPWIAERLAAIQPFFEAHAAAMDPVVAAIIGGARRYSSVDAFEAEYRLRTLRQAAELEWRSMDVLVVPSAPTIYTHEQIAADPVRLNTNLGYYTNFVNLLDQAAVAAPGGLRSDGLPFGITFIGPAFTDEALLELADRFHRSQYADVPGPRIDLGSCPPGCIALAVVGAHLSGQPLNRQLTERHARLLKTAKTSPCYRLYALPVTQPPKPGLAREEGFRGPGIEVEVWAIPENEFGSFVAAVPAPLGIGSATLENGEVVKGFICEPYGLRDAIEITHFGSWRAYIASGSLPASV
jgi:allophanate hydrolase